MKKTVNKFDKTDIYMEQIEQQMASLRAICNRNKIPMFCTVCIKNDNKRSEYKTVMVSAVSDDIVLKQDKIVDCVNVINGFTTVPFNNAGEFNTELLSEIVE